MLNEQFKELQARVSRLEKLVVLAIVTNLPALLEAIGNMF